jgi:hypothetical protein
MDSPDKLKGGVAEEVFASGGRRGAVGAGELGLLQETN